MDEQVAGAKDVGRPQPIVIFCKELWHCTDPHTVDKISLRLGGDIIGG